MFSHFVNSRRKKDNNSFGKDLVRYGDYSQAVTDTGPQLPCHLLQLPRELRLKIYEHLIPSGNKWIPMDPMIHLSVLRDKSGELHLAKNWKCSSQNLAILSVCRTTRYEFLPLYFRKTTIALDF